MSIQNFLPELRVLSRTEKLQLIQILAADLALEEGKPLLMDQGEYPIWTPYDSHEAAEVMLNIIRG